MSIGNLLPCFYLRAADVRSYQCERPSGHHTPSFDDAGLLAVTGKLSQGASLAAAMVMSMPDYLRLSLPGSLPELTLQRLLLLVIFGFWIRRPIRAPIQRAALFLGGLCLFGAAQLMSVILSVQMGASFKDWLSHAIAVVLFYSYAVRCEERSQAFSPPPSVPL